MNRDLLDDDFEAVDDPADNAPPPRDHNNPPGLLEGDALKISLQTSHAKLLAAAQALIDSEARVPRVGGVPDGDLECPDDEWEGKLTDVLAKIQDTHKRLDTARTGEKAPYDDAAAIVHNVFRGPMDKLVDPRPKSFNAYKHRLDQALKVYKLKKLRAAEERAEREAERRRWAERFVRVGVFLANLATYKAAVDAARLAEEAATKARGPKTNQAAATAAAAADAAAAAADRARAEEAGRIDAAANLRAQAETAAAAPAADRTRSRGEAAVSSLQEFVDFRDLDRDRLDIEVLRAHIPVAALEQAVRAYIQANSDALKDDLKNRRQAVRGVTFWLNHRNRTSK